MLEGNGSSAPMGVTYTGLTNALNLSDKTIMFWAYFDVLNTTNKYIARVRGTDGVDERWQLYSGSVTHGSDTLLFDTAFSGSTPAWYITGLTATTWLHFALTYNRTSTSNDPVIYKNAVSQTVTEISAPSGTVVGGSSSIFTVLSNSVSVPPIDGKLANLLVYNRILSASEITDAYNSRLAIPTYRGLVFAPQLQSRGEVGEGGTLTASHTFADSISGSLGTPSGSPLFKQDTYLTY